MRAADRVALGRLKRRGNTKRLSSGEARQPDCGLDNSPPSSWFFMYVAAEIGGFVFDWLAC